MPTYDYECNACKHRFEKFQSMSANPSRKCPKCGRMKLRRLIGGGAGIIFRGSGFYETDYKRAGEKKPKESTESKGSDSSSSSTSDSKKSES